MAEDQEKEELSTDEAAELERLLDDTGGGEAEAGGLKGKLQKILANKKLLMISGGGVLVIGAGAFFFMGDKEEEVVSLEEQVVEEEITEERGRVQS